MTVVVQTPLQNMQDIRDRLNEQAERKKTHRAGVRSEVRPGSRLMAKLLDAFILCAVLQIGSTLATGYVMHWLVALALFPLCESTVMWVFGNTPGKALFALKVTTQSGGQPDLSALLKRNYLCWFFGCAMWIPVALLITGISSRRHLEKNGIAGWDSRTGLLTVTGKISRFREAASILSVGLGPVLLSALVSLGA